MTSLLSFLLKGAWRVRNALAFILQNRTVGVRAMIMKEGQILLVKHTYQPDWYLPGGGVDKGESPLQAVIREVWEEGGVTPLEPPQLFGVYYNMHNGLDDYVVAYVMKEFKIEPMTSPEIAEAKWFPLEGLPKDTSPASRARIEEYLGVRPIHDQWSPKTQKKVAFPREKS